MDISVAASVTSLTFVPTVAWVLSGGVVKGTHGDSTTNPVIVMRYSPASASTVVIVFTCGLTVAEVLTKVVRRSFEPNFIDIIALKSF